METLSPDDESLLGEVGLPTQGCLRLAGPSHEAAGLVQKLLQINHVKYDWQFNTEGFHNHLSHSILAAFSLGASPELIQVTFDVHARVQRPMCSLRRKVSYQNWTRWLGQSEYYSSYLVFFMDEIKQYGAAATLERYLFKYKDGKLLMRAVSGALHPLIQIGHGAEFGLDALVAEGLAQACVHSAAVEPLFNAGWPHETGAAGRNSGTSPFTSAISQFRALRTPITSSFGTSHDSFLATLLRLNPSRQRQPRLGLSAFTIIAHILKDPRLSAGQANRKDDFPRLESALKNRGDLIRAWCSEWIVDPAGGWTECVEKTEELFWVAAVLVGASSRPGYRPRMDFFLMHTLTSAMFLPSLLELLSPASRIQLLHSHFRVMIGYWISRGRPHLYIKEVLMAASALPCAPMAISFGHGAIYRGLQKAKEAEQNSDQNEKTPERKDQAGEDHHWKEAAKDTNDNHDVDALADANAGEAVSLDEHVDVPLDTPTKDESADPMDLAGQPLLQRKQSRENEADGSSTPRQSNGHARFADFLPLHEHVVKDIPQGRVAQSSSSSWADLITSATDHTDEHVTKMVRSLVFAAQNFGMAPPGVHQSALSGTDQMDGTIFIRLAGLLMQSLGWEHFGGQAGDWDRSVLGFDEAWQDETREIIAFTAQEKGKGRERNERDWDSEVYKISSNSGRSIFDRKKDYPRLLDNDENKVGPEIHDREESEQDRLQRKYFEDDETDPHAFGEHQQWAEGVV